jgi:preprotein translocase subunit SecG
MTVILVVHLMIVIVLIGAVLLQKSEGGGLGMGGGAGFMSSRGTANLLTRTTAVLAIGFFATSLLLNWIASYERKPSSLITGQQPASQSQPAAPTSGGVLDTLKKNDQQSQSGGATPVAPPTSGGLLDTLRKADEQQNQAPSGPEAPKSQ